MAMLFERSADLIETFECSVIEAACFTGHAKQLPAEGDSIGLRLLAILLPIGVEDFFDDVRIQKCSERGEALEREPEANCHPDERHKLSAPIRDGSRTAGMDALAVRGAARLGKTGEIVVDVAAQTFGEFLPGRAWRP